MAEAAAPGLGSPEAWASTAMGHGRLESEECLARSSYYEWSQRCGWWLRLVVVCIPLWHRGVVVPCVIRSKCLSPGPGESCPIINMTCSTQVGFITCSSGLA